MNTLDALEAAGTGPLVYTYDEIRDTLPDPQEIGYQSLLGLLSDEVFTDLPRMPLWMCFRLFRAWQAHHSLPDFAQAQRLAYLVDHYHDEIQVDFRVIYREDIDALWRARRWTYALNLIDHLPVDCWYTEAVSNDEEHAKMVAEAMAERRGGDDDDKPKGPPLRHWNQQASMMAELIDAVREVNHTNQQIAGGKPGDFKSYKRPTTAIDRAQREATNTVRKARHDALAKRLLPHKATTEDPATIG